MASPDPRKLWSKQAHAGPSQVLCLCCPLTLTLTPTLLVNVKCEKDQLKWQLLLLLFYSSSLLNHVGLKRGKEYHDPNKPSPQSHRAENVC